MPWMKQVTPQQSCFVPSALQQPALIHCTPIPWPVRVVPTLLPSPIAPAGIEEGGTTGAGDSRRDLQGTVIGETRGNVGEGVRIHTRRRTEEGTEKQIQKDACERGCCCGKGWEQLSEVSMLCWGVIWRYCAYGRPRLEQ